MATTPVSLLLGSSAFKVYDKTLERAVMAKVKVLKTKLRLAATPARHMREDGTTIIDTRIVQPFVLEVDIICPDLNVANDVLLVMQNRSSLYRVTTKGLVLDDLRLMYDSMQQTAENLSSTPTHISFQQTLLQGVDQKITAQAADSSVLDRGIATLKETALGATQTVSDFFGRIIG